MITEFTSGLSASLPDDITPGADGNLWVAQSANPPGTLSIARITPAGVISEFSSSAITSTGSDADEIVAGPDGNLWFTDEGTAQGALGKVALQLAPTASTGNASAVTGSTATVSGSVDPLGSPTTVAFDFGRTPALGSTMTAAPLPASGTASTVTVALSRLPARTVIYYKVVASDGAGTTSGSVKTLTTAAGGGGGQPPSASPPQVTRATFGNQQITLTTPSRRTCTAAKAKTFGVMLSSAAIRTSHATKLRFLSAAFYLDRGVRHTRRGTKRLRNGKRQRVTVVVYTANAVAHRVPVTVRLRLMGLSSRSHTVKVIVSYKETVRRHGHNRTVTVTKTLSARFRVC